MPRTASGPCPGSSRRGSLRAGSNLALGRSRRDVTVRLDRRPAHLLVPLAFLFVGVDVLEGRSGDALNLFVPRLVRIQGDQAVVRTGGVEPVTDHGLVELYRLVVAPELLQVLGSKE